jgi:hypothetical protein
MPFSVACRGLLLCIPCLARAQEGPTLPPLPICFQLTKVSRRSGDLPSFAFPMTFSLDTGRRLDPDSFFGGRPVHVLDSDSALQDAFAWHRAGDSLCVGPAGWGPDGNSLLFYWHRSHWQGLGTSYGDMPIATWDVRLKRIRCPSGRP